MVIEFAISSLYLKQLSQYSVGNVSHISIDSCELLPRRSVVMIIILYMLYYYMASVSDLSICQNFGLFYFSDLLLIMAKWSNE